MDGPAAAEIENKKFKSLSALGCVWVHLSALTHIDVHSHCNALWHQSVLTLRHTQVHSNIQVVTLQDEKQSRTSDTCNIYTDIESEWGVIVSWYKIIFKTYITIQWQDGIVFGTGTPLYHEQNFCTPELNCGSLICILSHIIKIVMEITNEGFNFFIPNLRYFKVALIPWRCFIIHETAPLRYGPSQLAEATSAGSWRSEQTFSVLVAFALH